MLTRNGAFPSRLPCAHPVPARDVGPGVSCDSISLSCPVLHGTKEPPSRKTPLVWMWVGPIILADFPVQVGSD